MPTALETRAALSLVTGAAVEASLDLYHRLNGSPEQVRADLLDTVPALIDQYGTASATLGADAYDDAREQVGLGAYSTQLIIADRTETIRNAIAWAAHPLFDGVGSVESRLTGVVQPEVARPFRDTVIGNRRTDPDCVGWQRIAKGDACRFCLMLAGRGSVYKEATVNFAAHPHCDCTVQPVFYKREFIPGDGQGNRYYGSQGQSGRFVLRQTHVGPEATSMQYMASARARTPEQRAALRAYLEKHFPDSPD